MRRQLPLIRADAGLLYHQPAVPIGQRGGAVVIPEVSTESPNSPALWHPQSSTRPSLNHAGPTDRLCAPFMDNLPSGIYLNLISNARLYAIMATKGHFPIIRSSQCRSVASRARASRFTGRKPWNTLCLVTGRR